MQRTDFNVTSMLSNKLKKSYFAKKKGCPIEDSPVLKSSRQKLNDFKFAFFKGSYKENI